MTCDDDEVDLQYPLGPEFWALCFDVTVPELQSAAAHVGCAVHAVGGYLRNRPFLSKARH